MWSVKEHQAQWIDDHRVLSLDLHHPEKGISRAAVNGSTLAGAQLLQMLFHPAQSASMKFSDHYIRERDLVATYQAESFTPQIYWRIQTHEDARILGCEIVLSLQTHLLDVTPRITLTGNLPHGDVEQLSEKSAQFQPLSLTDNDTHFKPNPSLPGVFLFRCLASETSFVLLIHPSDYTAAKMRISHSSDQGIRWEQELLTERLEKGVIRRGRLCVLFVPHDRDRDFARDCYGRMTAEAPPLTA